VIVRSVFQGESNTSDIGLGVLSSWRNGWRMGKVVRGDQQFVLISYFQLKGVLRCRYVINIPKL
jgi:hypothetical protein